MCLSIVLCADCLGISTIYKAFKKTQRDSEKLNNKNFLFSSQYHAYFYPSSNSKLFTRSDNGFRILFSRILLFKVSEKLKTESLEFYNSLVITICCKQNAILDCPFKVCFIGDFLNCNTILYVANKMLFLMEPLNLFYG